MPMHVMPSVMSRFRISNIVIAEHTENVAKVVIQLRHFSRLYKPITVSMCLSKRDPYALYSYSCGFLGQITGPDVTKNLVDNCQDLAQNLLKSLEK